MAVQFPNIPQPGDAVEGHINHFFDHLIASINQRRLVLLAKARDTRHEMAVRPAALARTERELISARTEIERLLQMNVLRETQLELLGKLEEKLAEVRLPRPETRLVFRGECEQLEQLIFNLGDVLEEEVPSVPRYREMGMVVEAGKKGQIPVVLSNPKGVVIEENSCHIYVTDHCPARVSIFSGSGEFLRSFTHEYMKLPYGIDIHQNNVYVSDKEIHGVLRFKIESEMRLDAALVGFGFEYGKFNSPQQLTVSANGDVLIADYYNHRVQILDESLEFRRSIEDQSLRYPRDVKSTNNEVFVLTDSSPCVNVFSHAGDKIRSFITYGQSMQVVGACFFCLDAQKNIIISDGGANNVKIFSPDGTLIHLIGGFQVGLFSPLGLALTKQLKIVVIVPNNLFMLQIFSS